MSHCPLITVDIKNVWVLFPALTLFFNILQYLNVKFKPLKQSKLCVMNRDCFKGKHILGPAVKVSASVVTSLTHTKNTGPALSR